jgi:hypothetical protein
MIERLRRALLFALYQTTVVAGILLLPVALTLARTGVRLPLDRAVESTAEAYRDASR